VNGAQLIAEILKREGTEFLACYPRNPLIDACAEIDIRPILCRQERVGVAMADGFSRIRKGRQNGVFAAQHGPGIENTFPGVAQAFAENVPVLVIPASFPTDRHYQKPTFRAADVFRPVTKWSALAHHVNELPDLLRRAFHALRSGKPGPVLLEVPNDVFEANYQGKLDYRPVPVVRTGPDPDAVKRAVELLLVAKQPLLWAGQGVHYADASEKLSALAELLPAPVACTNPGKSAIAETHPLALGASTRSQPKMFAHFMARADLVLAIGSSLTKTSFGPALPKRKTLIHSTNDASDINKDIRADLAIVGDAELVLDALIAEVQRVRPTQSRTMLAELKEEIAALKQSWRAEWSKQLDSDEVPINQYRVIRDLMGETDRDNVIITHDAGSPREQLFPFWETTKPHSYLGWGKSTQLGYGLGLAMGAKLAAPEKICINVMGDSSFGMTGMDIETASRNGIAILTIVFNNSVMACERHVLETSTRKYGALSVGGNYAKVAEGLNVASRRVEQPSEIVPALRTALDTVQGGRPFLLEIIAKEGYEFSRYADR
jgi:acetolactate synthase I/II/III large subunit